MICQQWLHIEQSLPHGCASMAILYPWHVLCVSDYKEKNNSDIKQEWWYGAKWFGGSLNLWNPLGHSFLLPTQSMDTSGRTARNKADVILMSLLVPWDCMSLFEVPETLLEMATQVGLCRGPSLSVLFWSLCSTMVYLQICMSHPILLADFFEVWPWDTAHIAQTNILSMGQTACFYLKTNQQNQHHIHTKNWARVFWRLSVLAGFALFGIS